MKIAVLIIVILTITQVENNLMASDIFSPDYVTARDRFCDAARTAGADLYQLVLDARGPHGERTAPL